MSMDMSSGGAASLSLSLNDSTSFMVLVHVYSAVLSAEMDSSATSCTAGISATLLITALVMGGNPFCVEKDTGVGAMSTLLPDARAGTSSWYMSETTLSLSVLLASSLK